MVEILTNYEREKQQCEDEWWIRITIDNSYLRHGPKSKEKQR